MHSSTLDPLVPLKGVFASPAQACYLPDRCHEQIYQDSFTFLDEEDQNITECHILVLDELPPSAPRIGSAPLPFAPTELPRRAMVSLRRTPMIEMEDDDQDTTRNSHEVGISDQTQQPPPPPHGNPTPLPASTRPVGRSKGSKRFPRVVHPQTTHPEVFQSITCAPTLRHMSFEVSLTASSTFRSLCNVSY